MRHLNRHTVRSKVRGFFTFSFGYDTTADPADGCANIFRTMADAGFGSRWGRSLSLHPLLSLQRDRWDADILSFKMDGVLTGYPSPHTSDVLSACSSGGCPAHGSAGDAKQVYLCRPDTTCADVEIRNLRFVPGPASAGG